MDEQQNRTVAENLARAMAAGDVDGLVASYHEDAIVDWPQSGERIVGSANLRAVMRNYPGGVPSPEVRAIRTAGNLVVAEALVTYPDGTRWHTADIFELSGGRIAHETSYFGEAFEAPEWRAQWVESVGRESS